VFIHSSLTCGEWLTIGCLGLDQYSQLFVGDTVSVSFYDEHGELTQLAFDYEILSPEQGEPHAWSLLVVEHINMHIPLVCAGRMTEQGLVVAYRYNKIFALESSGICSAVVHFNRAEKNKKLITVNSLGYDAVYPQNGDMYSAGTKVLQPKTGHIYQCKAWPFSEFCRVNENSAMFEPGVGESWAMAWQQIQ
jgi:hypothetical protein